MSAKGQANSAGNASADGEANFDAEGDIGTPKGTDLEKPVAASQAQAAPPPPVAIVDQTPVLLGVRHDLSYQGPKTASCRCLAVALGEPSASAFAWSSTPPTIDPRTQLVVGVASDGVSCNVAVEGRVSYRGYTVKGDDVIVEVENSHEGRPVMAGAVIPKPIGSGQVYVKPKDKTVPYGAPLDGTGLCKVGNPGPARSLDAPEAPTESLAAAEPEEQAEEAETLVETTNEGEVVDEIEVMDDFGKERTLSQPYTRDGFFLGAHPGLGYLMLQNDDAKTTGFGLGVDILIGGALSEGFTIGGLFGGATFPSATPEVGGTEFTDVELNLFRLGAFVDYYFSPESGLHLLGDLGYATVGTGANNTSTSELKGFALGAALGNDWWVGESFSLGILGRLNFAALSNETTDGTVVMLLPELLLTVAYQ